MAFTVKNVTSPAKDCGILAGDVITHINGEKVVDNLDVLFFEATRNPKLTVNRGEEIFEVTICNGKSHEFGLEYCESPFGKDRACINKCVFCFVDQLPEGMRDSLYFKDDDWRMSFVMGNYVTLTNVSDSEFERIIRRKISPLFISVHAADDATRLKMVGKNIDLMGRLARLEENDISFHAQIVMVPGMNDGEVLEETIRKLMELMPCALSLSVVPVGLTKHRENLVDLITVDEECARRNIDIVEKCQRIAREKFGHRFVYASDEMYIRGNLKVPPYEDYDAFPQLENGVGMIANFEREVSEALEDAQKSAHTHVSTACGVDFYPYFKEIAGKVAMKTGVKITVYPVKNDFFGHTITVSGLLTGKDIYEELKDKDLGEVLLLCRTMFRQDTLTFLDDMELHELSSKLGVEIKAVYSDGYDFLDAICGI